MFDAHSPISRIALFAALFSTAVMAGGCAGSARSTGAASPASHGGSYSYTAGTAAGSGGSGSYAGEYGGGEGAKAEAAPASASDSGGSYASPSSPAVAGPSYSPPPAPVAKAPVATGTTAPKSAAPSGGAPVMPSPPPITVTTKTTVTVTPYPPPGTYEQESPTGGVLTAAIWDDDVMRPQFQNFLARYPQFQSQWGVDMTRRVTIRVEDSNGIAVGDAPIALRAPDGSIVNLRAHGDGTTYFWPTKSMLSYGSQYGQSQQGGTFSVAAQVGSLRTESVFSAPTNDTTWTVKLKGVPNRAAQPAIDVAFVVDCTGSMGDEIAYLQNELMGVVKRVKSEHAMRRVRLGLVLYRDRGDDYVTKPFGFTEDLGTYLGWLKQAQAMGGGDMPESVNAALADTVSKLDWAGDEAGRLAILVGDAPPHYYADEQYTYKNAIGDLNARGVKLVSVGASGIDKSTEYLFRQMSAYTGGRYVFLTDDSGVGDPHLVPDITGYQVEHLDKILVRVIGDEARAFKR